ncbi:MULTISPECIES: hypothetical protein [Rhodomicrobium]|uniref:hypothetical protein n=1 Tax=Rhodomicrobium TaxID=1068 RepID=UPI001595DD24|nr:MULTISPECIES: hypothetical protein [Rhodomicrobium]
MFQILILVCSIGTAQPDCQSDTALDVVRGPVVANEMLCGRDGQAYLAQTSIAPQSANDYVKIQCLRTQNHGELSKAPRRTGAVN